ncbi:MAG TPA: hypothetical protein VFH73_22190, partial [Polyangia bacterium]|nr:hypothetical protein [Polyangia bacterium]
MKHRAVLAAGGLLLATCMPSESIPIAGKDAGAAGDTPAVIADGGSGGSGGGTGGAGTGGSGGAGGGVPPADGSSDSAPTDVKSDNVVMPAADVADGASPPATAGCDQNNYPVCLDFEKGVDPKWTGMTAGNMQMGKAAHGQSAFHGPPGSMLSTTQLGTITNVVWGRLYLHMTPGGPVGHGELVGVYDQANNWYELGFEFNGLQGNWHGNGGEKYMRTKTKIPDKFVCVEFQFDGATPAAAKIWMDGQL